MGTIDLSQLAAPEVVESLSFETLMGELLADLQARDSAFTALVESDPAYKVLEVVAYRELLTRQRVNDAARQVMLAYAAGTDLEHLAALHGLERLLLDAGDPTAVPPVPPTYETDARLRERVQLAPEGRSTAGPVDGYVFHALSASASVADVDVTSPAAGEVVVTVLAVDGVPDAELLALVDASVNDRSVRPLTDQVTVQAATLVDYAVEATVHVYAGPDPAVVLAGAEAAAAAYCAAHAKLGHDIPLSGLYGALHQPGVQRVVLTAPVADVVIASHEASNLTGLTVSLGTVDE